jgi:hypothetical protein
MASGNQTKGLCWQTAVTLVVEIKGDFGDMANPAARSYMSGHRFYFIPD